MLIAPLLNVYRYRFPVEDVSEIAPPPLMVRPVGLSQDGANIQAALDWAANVGPGAVVGLYPGDWQLDRTLRKRGYVHLFGFGRGPHGTNVKAMASLNAEMLVTTGSPNLASDNALLVRGSMSGIRWDGNRANQSVTKVAVKVINCAWYQVANCAFANVRGRPFQPTASGGSQLQDEGEVTNCLFEDCDDGPYHEFEGGSVASPGDWRYTSCQFDRLDGDAVGGRYSNLNQFAACQFLSSGRGPHPVNGYGWTFTGCFSRNHQQENWLFENHTGGQITGGHSHLGSRAGINQYSGIRYLNSPDFQMTGVKSHDFFFGFAPINQRYGVTIDAASTGGVITGTDYRAAYNATGNYLDLSGTVVLSGNVP